MPKLPKDHFCNCPTPRIEIKHDDRGQRVPYCRNCWKPVKEEKQ